MLKQNFEMINAQRVIVSNQMGEFIRVRIIFSCHLFQIFICVMMGSMSLGQAFPILEIFGNGLAAAAKIFKIIEQKPKIDSSSDKGEKPDKISGRLEFRNVSFTYPARPEVQV